MRKIVLVAAVLGLAASVGVGAAPAAAAGTDVLTLGSVGGPNVAVGDVLKSGLKAGTVVTFGTLVTCAASTMASRSRRTRRPGTSRPGRCRR